MRNEAVRQMSDQKFVTCNFQSVFYMYDFLLLKNYLKHLTITNIFTIIIVNNNDKYIKKYQ